MRLPLSTPEALSRNAHLRLLRRLRVRERRQEEARETPRCWEGSHVLVGWDRLEERLHAEPMTAKRLDIGFEWSMDVRGYVRGASATY